MSVRYRRMQPHVMVGWQRLRYCANYLTQGFAEWRQVWRHSLMGRSLWRFDAIGGYPDDRLVGSVRTEQEAEATLNKMIAEIVRQTQIETADMAAEAAALREELGECW